MIFSKVLNLWSILSGMLGSILIVQSTLRKLDPNSIVDLSGTYYGHNEYQIRNLIDIKIDTVSGLVLVIFAGLIEMFRLLYPINLEFCFVQSFVFLNFSIVFIFICIIVLSKFVYKPYLENKVKYCAALKSLNRTLGYIKQQLDSIDINCSSANKNQSAKGQILKFVKKFIEAGEECLDESNCKTSDFDRFKYLIEVCNLSFSDINFKKLKSCFS